MKYIFNVEPEDFVLASRALKFHMREWPDSISCAVGYETNNGEQIFYTRRNKESYSVWKA